MLFRSDDVDDDDFDDNDDDDDNDNDNEDNEDKDDEDDNPPLLRDPPFSAYPLNRQEEFLRRRRWFVDTSPDYPPSRKRIINPRFRQQPEVLIINRRFHQQISSCHCPEYC